MKPLMQLTRVLEPSARRKGYNGMLSLLVTDDLKYLPTILKSSRSIRWKQLPKQQTLELSRRVENVAIANPVVFNELVGNGYISSIESSEWRQKNHRVPITPSTSALFVRRELVEAEDNKEKLKQPTLKLEVFLVSVIQA